MRARTLPAVLAAAAIALALALAPSASVAAGAAANAAASATPSQLDGSCSFTGPIKPTPGITVVPKSGPHFSFSGKGTCDGHLHGKPIAAAPVAVSFDNVETVFDTCEFGPDVNLPGTLTIGASRFAVTVDLARAVLAGPLRITTTGGGLGVGSAQFQPGDASAAPSQCLSTGLDNASLTASFTTLAALVGETRPAASAAPGARPPNTAPGHASGPKPRRAARRSHRRRTRRHRDAGRRPARHDQREGSG